VLSKELQALWDEYLSHEHQHVRPEMLESLGRFIEEFQRLPIAERFSWARSIAEGILDRKAQIPVRMPLFRQVIFPALLSGYRDALPGCARWLAGFPHLLCRAPECLQQLGMAERGRVQLLRTALKQDPNDRLAIRILIEALASEFEYALHEVPAGVLYDSRGATAEQCGELLRETHEFYGHVVGENMLDEYRELIDDCRLHFAAYAKYQNNRDRFKNYQEYLAEVHDLHF
jgi:hypothetical protein